MFEDRVGRLQGGQSARAFEVEGASYFDGTGHRLGPSLVTIKSDRVIIDGTRGGMHQVLIRDIGGVGIPNRVLAPKKLLIEVPGAAYEIYCQSKDQVRSIEAEIRDVIMG